MSPLQGWVYSLCGTTWTVFLPVNKHFEKILLNEGLEQKSHTLKNMMKLTSRKGHTGRVMSYGL